MARRRKSMSVSEEDAFNAMLEELMDDLTEYAAVADMEESMDCLRKLVNYNVPHGKQIRGRSVVSAYRLMAPSVGAEDIRLTYVLGWCVELLQASFLMADDMIDNSETRRGRPCWYQCPGVGNSAINDSFILYGLLHYILDMKFKDHPSYAELTQLFHNVYLKTCIGQSIDIRASKLTDLRDFKKSEYWRLVEYKTSYYTFYLPVVLAMILAGKNNPEDLNDVKELTLQIGQLFQVQDDYLDVFGESSHTGKFGSDISENKCSWLIVNAFDESNERQKRILMENYGKGPKTCRENIARVKNVFLELKMKEKYNDFEESAYASITQKINSLSKNISKEIFQETVDLIYRRSQ